ncbi:MAG TPA: hypothetical protein VFH33_09045 [Candidatus Krumholzibacteria bacterium]|nr:hypothetical protein [Candidatus Krumholzibacteria bacterium]
MAILALVAVSCHKSSPRPDWTYAFVDTCITVDIDTSAWQLIDGPTITFRIPPGYVPSKSTSIDTEGAEFERGEGRIGYCFSCTPYALAGGFFRCRETINGREAFVIRGPAGDHYLTAATWINPDERCLVLVANTPDRESDKEALAAIRSARLKRPFDRQQR